MEQSFTRDLWNRPTVISFVAALLTIVVEKQNTTPTFHIFPRRSLLKDSTDSS